MVPCRLFALPWLVTLGCLWSGAFGLCRFAPFFSGEGLVSDIAMQDAYVQEMLEWDGRFATPGYGIFSDEVPLSCDHAELATSGEPQPTQNTCYTAASKESLNIQMLALVVARAPLAWHWMAHSITEPASDEQSAVELALERLTGIIAAYENFHASFPGLGGFIPWVTVGAGGFVSDGVNVQLPALDNGQLAWAFMAAEQALRQSGSTELADRYGAYVGVMVSSLQTLFFNENDENAATYMIAQVPDARAPLDVDNRVGSGVLADPYEGELMILLLDLYGTWEDPSQREKLWKWVRENRVVVEYEHEGLPEGPISVQRGWRFSSHEQWKYLVLPYLDHPLASRAFANGERARTWNSRLEGIPGLMGSCYNADGVYVDTYGIQSISMGFDEPPRSELMVTPYGAYPVVLAHRGYGLAWHRAMLMRAQMEDPAGSTEAGQAFGDRVAMKTSWDTKVTTDVAVLGGTADLLRQVLQSDAARWERWNELMDDLNQPYAELSGEATPFAMPPDVESAPLDFDSCVRASASAEAASPAEEVYII